jgi:hypothetical protein
VTWRLKEPCCEDSGLVTGDYSSLPELDIGCCDSSRASESSYGDSDLVSERGVVVEEQEEEGEKENPLQRASYLTLRRSSYAGTSFWLSKHVSLYSSHITFI